MKQKSIALVFTTSVTRVFLIDLLAFLGQKKIKVYIVCHPDEVIKRFCKDNEISFYPVEMYRKISPFRDLLSVLRLTLFFRNVTPDVVHAFTPKAGMIGMLAAKMANVSNRIYHILGLHFINRGPKLFKFFANVEKFTCALSTMNLTVSQSLKEEIINLRLTHDLKIKAVQKGSFFGVDTETRFNRDKIDSDEIRKLKVKFGMTENDFVIGFVGRLNRDKGIGDLLIIHEEMVKKYRKVKLLIIGDLDEERAIEQAHNIKIRNDKSIICTGWLENPRLAMCCLDLLLHPSSREGFGNVIIEAGALGVPAIAYRIPGTLDAVQHKKTGFLAEKGDYLEMLNFTEAYFNNNELLKTHGKNSRKYAEEFFSPSLIINEIYNQHYRF